VKTWSRARSKTPQVWSSHKQSCSRELSMGWISKECGWPSRDRMKIHCPFKEWLESWASNQKDVNPDLTSFIFNVQNECPQNQSINHFFRQVLLSLGILHSSHLVRKADLSSQPQAAAARVAYAWVQVVECIYINMLVLGDAIASITCLNPAEKQSQYLSIILTFLLKGHQKLWN
jgi:hypothetical protein